jgi:hypothetical protein
MDRKFKVAISHSVFNDFNTNRTSSRVLEDIPLANADAGPVLRWWSALIASAA